MPDGTTPPSEILNEAARRQPAQPDDLLSRSSQGSPVQADMPALNDKAAVQDLVQRLQKEAPAIAQTDPDLSKAIGDMAQIASKPGGTESRYFANMLAYNLHDVEQLRGPIGTVPADLRNELQRLATNVPGLENDRLKALIAEIPDIDSTRTRMDIRGLALRTARDGGDQNSPEVMSRVDALEKKIWAGMPSVAPPSVAQSGDPGYDPDADRGTGATASARGQEASSPPHERGPTGDPGRPVDQKTVAESASVPAGPEKSPVPPVAAPVTQPGMGSATVAMQQGAAPATTDQVMQQGAVRAPSALDRLIASAISSVTTSTVEELQTMRSAINTNIRERLQKSEAAVETRRDDATIKATEAAGQAVTGAVQALQNGPAGTILTEIRDAIKNNAGGAAEVLSEMKEGGRFADLRERFNVAVVQERGAAAALDNVASTLQAYGEGREAVAAIGAKRGTASALESKFEKLDKEIGEATSMLPGKGDGKSIVDDLTEKLKEVLDRAVNAVKSAFTPSTEKTASGPTASP